MLDSTDRDASRDARTKPASPRNVTRLSRSLDRRPANSAALAEPRSPPHQMKRGKFNNTSLQRLSHDSIDSACAAV